MCATPTTPRARRERRVARAARSASAAAGLATLRRLRGLRRAGASDQARAAALPDRGQGRPGKRVVGYGAPGKGNTLLNYCGIRTDFLDYTVDRNPYKQGKFLPGTRIPILAPEQIHETRPDYVLILPWNLKDEIVAQLASSGNGAGVSWSRSRRSECSTSAGRAAAEGRERLAA